MNRKQKMVQSLYESYVFSLLFLFFSGLLRTYTAVTRFIRRVMPDVIRVDPVPIRRTLAFDQSTNDHFQ